MRASYEWLSRLSGVDAPASEIAERLTRAGLEVEGTTRFGAGLDRVVIAEVRAAKPHPKKDNLRVATVFDGEREVEVVCGAPNLPAAGGRVLFARVGAKLPNGMEIAERSLAGVTSIGMICSEAELGIGPDADGIFIASRETIGAPVATALALEDTVFEIGLTPNRPDCLGHVGLAREIAVAFGKPFDMRKVEPVAQLDFGKEGPAIEVASLERCPRYGAAIVRDVRVGPSPFAIRYLLHRLGVRAISNVVDASNLILFGWGHPIHTFDLDRLRGQRISVRLAREGEKTTTLDGAERSMTSDDLLICDGEGPVAIAGVMGCANSEIRDDTKNVLIECAYFEPRGVRRTARRLGMHTDASHRFERGVDRGAVPHVLAASAERIHALAGGAVQRTATDVGTPGPKQTISLRRSRVRALLGVDVATDEMTRTLRGLGCEPQGEGYEGAGVAVVPPSWRVDLSREADLIEELIRVKGYDAIPTTVPSVRPSAKGTPFAVRFDRKLREAAAHAGLDEAVNYAFVSPTELASARAPEPVRLLNPLSEERSVLRTSLLPGLASNVRRAQRRQATSVHLFELARTFYPTDDAPSEQRVLGVILWGARGAWIGEGEPVDFYDGKGAIEAIGARMGLSLGFVIDAWLDRATHLHPKRRARIDLGGDHVGYLGELHPDVSEAFELEGRVIYGELHVGTIAELVDGETVRQARPLPRFPHVSRDIAMLVSDLYAAGDIAAALKVASGGLAEEVRLFDLYRGEHIPKGQRSLAFRVVYLDRDETLTDKRVDAAHAKVVEAAKKQFSAVIR